jgi:cytoskeletal protein CcmA (bactofilin family)
MFSKKITGPSSVNTKALPARKSVPSIFSGDVVISGDIYSDGEINIDGKIEGNIKSRRVILGPSGSVKGNVTADFVSVSGRFEGKIIASKVFLASTARVIGEITHESLEIEMGAYLEGVCHRTTEPMPAAQDESEYMITDLTDREVVVEFAENQNK